MGKALTRIWAGWKEIAFKFARLQTNLLLTLFYFLILAPLGLLFRLFGWDPLESRARNFAKITNWRAVSQGEPDLDALRRQS